VKALACAWLLGVALWLGPVSVSAQDPALEVNGDAVVRLDQIAAVVVRVR
jgi:hypothetical protein